MKINKQKNPLFTKKVLIPVISIFVIVLGLFTYLYVSKSVFFGWQPFAKPTTSNINYSKPTEEQVKSGATIKQGAKSQGTTKSTPEGGSDQPPAPVPQSNGTSTIQLTIISTNQTTTTLQIRAQVATVTSSGTCTLTMTKTGSAPISQVAQLQPYASVSTCRGFDIPLSQLPAGQWNIAIHFSSGNLVGDASQTVTIQ